MASYPSSVVSFTTKTDDIDVIQAGHINLLQDEVAAIQVELGTSPSGGSLTVRERAEAIETSLSGKAANPHDNASHSVAFATEAALTSGLGTKLNLSGGTLTGDVVLHSYRERETTSSSSTMTVNFTGAQVQETTNSGALTVEWSNLPSSGQVRSVTMVVGSNVTDITWPTGTRFSNGTAPTLDGETWLVAVARGTQVTVLLAGAGMSA